jgi:hypothetical protein
MRKLSANRRRMVVLASSTAAFSGVITPLMVRRHLVLGFMLIGLQMVMLAKAMLLLAQERAKGCQ